MPPLASICAKVYVLSISLFSNDDIRKSIQRSGVDSMIKKEFRKTTNKMFELDTKIDKLEDLADTNYSHSNKFLRNL